MLSATTDIRLGSSRERTSVLFERCVRGYVIWRENLAFDTRFFASAPHAAPPCGHLVVLLEGELAFAGEAPLRGPVAFLFGNHEIERIDPTWARRFRIGGPITRAIHLRIPARFLRVPPGSEHGPLALDAATWAAAERLAPRHPPVDQFAEVDPAALRGFLDAAADAGIVSEDLAWGVVDREADALVRLWSAARPFFNTFEPSTALRRLAQDLALSPRQISRDIANFATTFDLRGRGFRHATHILRIRTATLLLSAPGVTATAVADRLGYGTLTAFGRAFRDAGLPPPSEVAAGLRAGDAGLPATVRAPLDPVDHRRGVAAAVAQAIHVADPGR